ncbi:hypothetical protein F444_12662 [Phytophthora nicotianae P1976]|uniref:MULE transposase domain-containing protein n=1 Tax=Phytophthora nicotianae P1976 TaxID=1317066 RepID=A0A080ZWA4_PHYNI|nr:hypothetical protein F444_12662 [Phytophthora nicotianae P1976]
MQFYDNSLDPKDITCPFSINVSGINGNWKLTRVNFTHNHVKHVGFSGRPVAEGYVARPASDKRNRTQDAAALTQLVEAEMLPRYENKTERMTGAAIASFLLGKGHKIALSAISRIKAAIDERLRGNQVDSYQKLEGCNGR